MRREMHSLHAIIKLALSRNESRTPASMQASWPRQTDLNLKRNAFGFQAWRFFLAQSIHSVTVEFSVNLYGVTREFWRRLVFGRSNGRPRGCLRIAQKDFMCIRRAFRAI